MSVAEGLVNDNWNISFKRCLGNEEAIQWESLKSMLAEVELNNNHDRLVWFLEKSEMFTIKSLHREFLFGGGVCRKLQKLWKCKSF